ncbi:MAG TPA: hypothetical protein VHS31_06855 [Tepidisphaeraceae bacterium]|jgi:hypothetical protein|nr:hypothetical protein [Tepidisphaeraceae bacterium]
MELAKPARDHASGVDGVSQTADGPTCEAILPGGGRGLSCLVSILYRDAGVLLA